MRNFVWKLIKLYAFILLFLYPFHYLIEKKEKELISLGTDNNFVKWSEFHRLESCNTIFLGSSKIYCSIKPTLFDSITGLSSYNLGTGNQSIIESYYYLKHAAKKHKLKNVVFDLYTYSMKYADFMNLRRNMQFLDKQSKRELYTNSGFAKNIFCDVIPLLEYSKYLQKIPESIKYYFAAKGSKITKNQKIEWEKGYSIADCNDFSPENVVDINKLDRKSEIELKPELLKNIEYLDLIIGFCKLNGINLILTNLPQGKFCQVTYNESVFFAKYLKKNKSVLFFYDYPTLTFRDIRRDGFHINNYGAKKLTKTFGNYIRKTHTKQKYPN